MPQKSVFDFSFTDFFSYLESSGEKPFRARQIFNWIYRKSILDFNQMKNLPSGLRRQLQRDVVFPVMECSRQVQDDSGTTKFVFELFDGEKIETVLIPMEKRLTVCVSTQAGCKFGCRFCASGIGGWQRNLDRGEIMMQVLRAQAYAQAQSEKALTHVVFMGTGEPLDNWEEVKHAIEMINAPEGCYIAARRITISTCGIAPKLKDVAAFDRQVELAVSLHGYNDAVRSQLLPVNQTYPLKQLIAACRDYVHQTHRQITFEYVVIEGLTCTGEAPRKLSRLLQGLECKINLISYNVVDEFDWKTPSRNVMYRFRDALIEQKLHVTIRGSKGLGADGACGQLRRR